MTIKHNFFGKECVIDKALSDLSNIESALKEKGFDSTNIMFVNQIHSAQVCVIDSAEKIHATQNLPKADAIVTNLPSLAIAIITADCSPILLQDEDAKVVAAIHAGWRGAKLGVIKNAVVAMIKLGAQTAKITAYIGPMIHQKSYQVSEEFLQDFIADEVENKKFFIDDKSSLSHHLFDLPAYVKNKLREQKITNIDDINIDTYSNYQQYASYRKSTHDGVLNSSRNISVIVIN